MNMYVLETSVQGHFHERGKLFIMKKSIRSIALFGVCALSLTACGEVSFADFQTKAKAALEKTVEYKTAEVSGTAKSTDSSSKSEKNISVKLNVSSARVFTPTAITDLDGIAYAALITSVGLGTFTVTENTSYKYYAGSTFKVAYDSEEDGTKVNNELSWNDVGLVTAIKMVGKDSDSKTTYNITVKYSK